MDRSPVYGINVVKREPYGKAAEWLVNVFRNNSPYFTLGPYVTEVTIPEAMQLVAVELKLNYSL